MRNADFSRHHSFSLSLCLLISTRRVILQNDRTWEGQMEIEAKFAVPDEATGWKLQTAEQIAGYALSPGEMKQVHDTFVDTSDRAILASGHVCRHRQVGGKI